MRSNSQLSLRENLQATKPPPITHLPLASADVYRWDSRAPGGGGWTASTLDLMPPGAPGSSLEIPTGLLWPPTHLIQADPSRSLLLACLCPDPWDGGHSV